MMGFDGGWWWLGGVGMIALLVGVILLVIWAAQGGPRRAEDDGLAILRARYARGEIDADEWETRRRSLAESGSRAAPVNFGLIGVLLIAAGFVLVVALALLSPGGDWRGPDGMMGPGMGWMMGGGSAPTAPPGTSVTMAGSRFEPATLSVAAGETVRWFNDDSVPHTVTASDRDWDSGHMAIGDEYERRFDRPGSYPYVCLYHPGMVGTIEVGS